MPETARKQGLPHLRAAIATDPLSGEAHYRLATTYKMLQMPDDAQREMKLFQEIKKTRDEVGDLYRQMNRTPKPEDNGLHLEK